MQFIHAQRSRQSRAIPFEITWVDILRVCVPSTMHHTILTMSNILNNTRTEHEIKLPISIIIAFSDGQIYHFYIYCACSLFSVRSLHERARGKTHIETRYMRYIMKSIDISTIGECGRNVSHNRCAHFTVHLTHESKNKSTEFDANKKEREWIECAAIHQMTINSVLNQKMLLLSPNCVCFHTINVKTKPHYANVNKMYVRIRMCITWDPLTR